MEVPELRELHVVECFDPPPGETQLPPPVVSITAPELVVLEWRTSTTQGPINFAHQLLHLRSLGTFLFFVYGDDDVDSYNRDCLEILEGFQSIETLALMLGFAPVSSLIINLFIC